MDSENKNLEDIRAIRQMMEDSSKFLSLSGLSGIAAGVFALLGASYTYFFIFEGGQHFYNEYMISLTSKSTLEIRISLLIVAALVFIAACISGFWFSYKKAKKAGTKLWSITAKKIIFEMGTILVLGGTFCLILIIHGDLRMVASTTLLFYGISLISIAKYTHRDIKYLGYCQAFIGLISALFLSYGIVFWSIGFGLLHIIYGVVMYLKYDRCKD